MAIERRRFHGQRWALVPGPRVLTRITPSDRVDDVRHIGPETFQQAFLDVRGARVLRPPTPDWWAWRGAYEGDDDRFELEFTLFEIEPVAWGGCPLAGPSSALAVLRLCSELHARLGSVFLHSDEALMYPAGEFERLFVLDG